MLSQAVCGERGSPKGRLFGRFFQDVDGCLEVMKTQSAIASGSAVLWALLPEAQWEPSDLDLFLGPLRVLEDTKWVDPWVDFLGSQGYELERGVEDREYHESQVCWCQVTLVDSGNVRRHLASRSGAVGARCK